MRVREADVEKVAFKCRFGHYEFLVTPFSLCNALATFQSLMNIVLHELLDVCVLSYIDDMLVYSPTKEQHVKDVTKVLQLLWKNKIICEIEEVRVVSEESSISRTRDLGGRINCGIR